MLQMPEEQFFDIIRKEGSKLYYDDQLRENTEEFLQNNGYIIGGSVSFRTLIDELREIDYSEFQDITKFIFQTLKMEHYADCLTLAGFIEIKDIYKSIYENLNKKYKDPIFKITFEEYKDKIPYDGEIKTKIDYIKAVMLLEQTDLLSFNAKISEEKISEDDIIKFYDLGDYYQAIDLAIINSYYSLADKLLVKTMEGDKYAVSHFVENQKGNYNSYVDYLSSNTKILDQILEHGIKSNNNCDIRSVLKLGYGFNTVLEEIKSGNLSGDLTNYITPAKTYNKKEYLEELYSLLKDDESKAAILRTGLVDEIYEEAKVSNNADVIKSILWSNNKEAISIIEERANNNNLFKCLLICCNYKTSHYVLKYIRESDFDVKYAILKWLDVNCNNDIGDYQTIIGILKNDSDADVVDSANYYESNHLKIGRHFEKGWFYNLNGKLKYLGDVKLPDM